MAGPFGLAAMLLLAAPVPRATPADVLFAELGLPAPPGPGMIAPEYAPDDVDAAAVRKNPKLYPFRAAVLDAADRLKDARAFGYEADLKPVRGLHPFGPAFDRDPPQRHCVDESKGQVSDGSTIVPNRYQTLREKVATQQADLADAAAVLRKAAHLRDKELSARWKAHFDYLTGEIGYRQCRHNDFNFAIGNAFAVPDNKDKSAVWRLNPSHLNRGGGHRQLFKEAVQNLLAVEEEHAAGPWAKLSRDLLETPPGFAWDIMPEK
jgi:hypothetical protein